MPNVSKKRSDKAYSLFPPFLLCLGHYLTEFSFCYRYFSMNSSNGMSFSVITWLKQAFMFSFVMFSFRNFLPVSLSGSDEMWLS